MRNIEVEMMPRQFFNDPVQHDERDYRPPESLDATDESQFPALHNRGGAFQAPKGSQAVEKGYAKQTGRSGLAVTNENFPALAVNKSNKSPVARLPGAPPSLASGASTKKSKNAPKQADNRPRNGLSMSKTLANSNYRDPIPNAPKPQQSKPPPQRFVNEPTPNITSKNDFPSLALKPKSPLNGHAGGQNKVAAPKPAVETFHNYIQPKDSSRRNKVCVKFYKFSINFYYKNVF